MTDNKITQRYKDIISSYVEKGDEHSLYEVSGLARACLAQNLGPEILVETHFSALSNLLVERDSEVQESVVRANQVLLEAMITYGLVYRDILERKSSEYKALEAYSKKIEREAEQLEAAQEELIKREKLSVLGQLTATVSHDLRSPLGVIRSSAFYLQRKLGGDVDEKITKHLNRIEKQIDLCDKIVGDLLEFTRGRHSEVVQGEINPLLEKVLEEIATPEQVTLVSELSPELPMVLFDREKMRGVMINLFQNAFKAVNLRRDIWNDEEGPYQPLVKVTTSKADNGICIEVEDNGTGMDHETARRAFEPLFTTSARGTGLGLAIVKKIVEEHSGSVSLESIPNHGTKVTLVIPAGT